MANNLYNAPFDMPIINEPTFPNRTFYASEGCSIQATINQCISAGGGTIVVPAGEWATGPLHLSDNTHLHFEDGAILIFSSNPDDYLPVVFTRWEGMECYNYSPLIYANNCKKIAVTGNGKLLGSGSDWWHWKQLQQEAANELCYAEYNKIPVKERVYGTKEAALRPSFLQFINCSEILIDGITLVDGPQWTLHPVYCENMIIRNVTVRTAGHNTDGLNPDSCKNVLIENCDFSTGDDCIAINSGMNEDGWRVNRPCENILIRNCVMSGGHGAVVIGSAMSGGVRNIYAHNCYIKDTMQGIRLKSMRGRGGFVENVTFENFEINNVSNESIQINMFYEFSTVVPKSNAASSFKNITIRNINGVGADTAIMLKGLPEKKLENITLEDISLKADKYLVCTDVDGLSIKNVELTSL